MSPAWVTREGMRIYEEKLKDKLEPGYKGQYAVIDAETGDYFVAKELMQATKKAEKKYPHKIFYLKKIGFEAAFRLPTLSTAGTISL